MKKVRLMTLLSFLLAFSVSAEANLHTLLFGYLKNDLSLQKYTLTAQLKALSYDSTKVSNGIELTLSTGTVKIQSSEEGTRYSFTPSASLSIPQASNTSLSASLPMTRKSGYETTSQNGTYLDNGTLKLSTGIITSKPLERKVSLLEAERAYIEAERAAQNQALTVENEFYTNLKTIYTYAQKVLTAKDDLYDDELALRVLEVQGYSKTSSSYRTKYLKCQSDKRTVAENLRKLERETAVFASKCGAEYNRVFTPENFASETEELENRAYESVMAFLPKDIPGVEMEDVLSYKSEEYTKTESAEWSKYISDLKRKTNYNLELGAYGGYTFNESTSKYDTVDGGITFDWRGIKASAGVSVPTGQNIFPLSGTSTGTASKSPVYTFSLTLTPNTWRLASIDKKQDAINEQIDEIAVKTAADDYDTAVLEKLTERSDLAWSEKSYAEEYDMYSQLEYDMDKWLSQGSVTQSDYLDAANNRDNAKLNILINAVEKIIYNNNVKMMFVKTESGKLKTES